jgi:galactonate dehydratase
MNGSDSSPGQGITQSRTESDAEFHGEMIGLQQDRNTITDHLRGSVMRITGVEPILCDGGFRTWIFVKVTTDEGIVGYGDASMWQFPRSVAEAVRYLAGIVEGEDPRDIERLYWKMWDKTTRALGGIAHVALAGIDNALWDIKGRLLGVPVYELLSGMFRERPRLYWSHCGTHRVFRPEVVGRPRIDSYEGISRLGEEVVGKGFTALKTNIFNPTTLGTAYPGSPRKTTGPAPMDRETLRDAVRLVETFREAVGDDVDIILDAACGFNAPAATELARAMEPYRLLFLEEPIPPDNPEACLAVKRSTRTPICMSEGLYSVNAYRPFLELGAIDVAMPDIAWVGLTMGRRIASLCEAYRLPVAPHSPHSPLCTIITGHFSASTPNLLIQEVEVDDVPWRDRVLSEPLRIREGHLELPDGPGFGVELVEDEIVRHPSSS